MRNIFLGILFVASSAFGQEFNFDIHGTSLKEYLSIEKKLGSSLIPTTSNHVSSSGNAQPIKFQREQDVIPDLIVYYYFKKKDSVMSHILYEWDVRHFKEKEERYAKESEELERGLITKYNELEKKITSQFGESTVTGDLKEFDNVNQKEGLKKKNIWTPNDSTEIKMYTAISNYYETNGAVTIAPTHRIRLYVNSKSKKVEKTVPKLDDNKLSELENIKSDFFKALESKDLFQSKEYLSQGIKDKVTDEQLNMLIDNIDFKRETELIYSGIQMGFNGSSFIILQYKYSDDKSSPPIEMIKIIFDDKDKVVGIQPMKTLSENAK